MNPDGCRVTTGHNRVKRTTGAQWEDTSHRLELHEKIRGQHCSYFDLCSKRGATGKNPDSRN